MKKHRSVCLSVVHYLTLFVVTLHWTEARAAHTQKSAEETRAERRYLVAQSLFASCCCCFVFAMIT